MTQANDDPKKGPGTTSDPNQADINDLDPWPAKDADVPRDPKGPKQTNGLGHGFLRQL